MVRNMMKEEVDGNYTLTGHETINGMIVGSLSVAAGAYCELNGTVTADLVAATGATVAVNGTVGGNLISMGADVVIRGVVRGAVVNRLDGGTVRIHPDAIVGRVERA